MFRQEAKEISDLIAEADDAIPEIPVKADLLREFLTRLLHSEDRLKQQLACLRQREEIGVPREPELLDNGTCATIDHIERIAQTYFGVEFFNLENSVYFLKRLFAAVRDGDQDEAIKMVRVLDAGLDSRPWLKEEVSK